MNTILAAIEEHTEVLASLNSMTAAIRSLADELLERLHKGGTIYFCGNGGSAADAQHLAAELVGRFKRERRALASVALSTDSSVLTCVGNDYSFDEIFSRQVEALVRQGDVLVGISTSGNSRNVLRGIQAAKQQGAITVGLIGNDGGELANQCDHALIIPSANTARIQEMHILIGHILCELIDSDPTIL